MIFVAIAYWCDDTWVIAAGHDPAAVKRDADAYMAKHRAIYALNGKFAYPDPTGRCAESYFTETVEESR